MTDLSTNHEAIETLRSLKGENCIPSPDSIDALWQSDTVLISGQFVGAGKSTYISGLEQDGKINIASYTNRDLRPGEVQGIDKVQCTVDEMADLALAGFFLELEEVRPGQFYATPAKFDISRGYVKDLELSGALRLRNFAPEIPIIVPVPPLNFVPSKRVTEWERRLVIRDGFDRSISDKELVDLSSRMQGAANEVLRIVSHDLVDDPNTFVVVNDDLERSLHATRMFLRFREKNTVPLIKNHLLELYEMAQAALAADC